MSRIVEKWWFTPSTGDPWNPDVIGIVKVHDDITNEDKFYIGCAYQGNEELDAENIAKNGAKFFPEVIK